MAGRTFNREEAWDEEENELEHLETHNNELVCYLSNRH